jgi:hypothetical protein
MQQFGFAPCLRDIAVRYDEKKIATGIGTDDKKTNGQIVARYEPNTSG